MYHMQHDLFLLMLNLSQLSNGDRIIEVFVEAMNKLQDQVVLRYETDGVSCDELVPIATLNNRFGYIVFHYDAVSDELLAVLRNAVRMLAVVLENARRAHLLQSEKDHLEAAVRERAAHLLRSEARYRSLVEHAPVPILAHRAFDIIFVNAAALELLGATSEAQVMQQPLIDFIAPDQRTGYWAGLDAIADDPAIVRRQAGHLVRLDGTVREVEATAIPIELDDQPARLVVVVDVTERNQAQAERLQSEKLRLELEQERDLSEMKSSFMSLITHELRNPLAAIDMTLELLTQYWDRLEAAERDREFDKIRSQLQLLGKMLDDASVVSRATSARLRFEPVPTNLAALVEKICHEARTTFGSRHNWQCLTNGPLPTLMVDHKLFGYILGNLLNNAVKYSPPGTVVRIELKHEASEVVCCVQDQGMGIPPDEIAFIFDAYFRASNTAGVPGSGLGLKILTDCVEIHGGHIEVESEMGQGSTFSVYLPVEAAS